MGVYERRFAGSAPEEDAPAGDSRLLLKIKQADESVTASVVLQDDDELSLAVEANKIYIVELWVFATGSTGDLKWRFSAPAGSAMQNYPDQTNPQASFGDPTTGDMSNTIGSDTAATPSLIFVRLFLTTAGTAGTLQFRWAQGTSSGTATVVRKGSALRLYVAAA